MATTHTACGWRHAPATPCPEQQPLDALAYTNLAPDAVQRLVVNDMDGLRPPERIAVAQRLVTAAQDALQAEIDAARGDGVTWSLIGAALATSRQNAYQRFGRD